MTIGPIGVRFEGNASGRGGMYFGPLSSTLAYIPKKNVARRRSQTPASVAAAMFHVETYECPECATPTFLWTWPF